MFKKLYEELKKNIKKNYKELIIIIIFSLIATIELPYVITKGGGIETLKDRIEIENAKNMEGAFYASYVSELKCNPITYLYAKLRGFKIEKTKNLLPDGETIEDDYKRNSILFDKSLNDAIYLAYTKSFNNVNIIKEEKYIVYRSNKINSDLKIGDKIISIEGVEITNDAKLKESYKNKKAGDKISITVEYNNKIYERYAYLYEEDNNLLMGISLATLNILKTDIDYKIKSYKGLGPSGGLMTSLYVYNMLTEYDYTKGLKIAGTGTIDIYGNVGEIGGITYKIKGAAEDNANIFLCPAENYDEALTTVLENDLDIELVSVKTFDDALLYLYNYKK